MGYPKHIYRRGLEELARRREAARELAAARAAEVAEKLPEAAAIQRELAGAAAAVVKLAALSPEKAGEAIGRLKDKNLALQKKRGELLEAAGYPKDYLTEKSPCDICGGGGYTNGVMCSCLRRLLRDEAYKELGAVSRIKNSTFENFSLDMYPDRPDKNGISPRAHMSGVLDACQSYAAGFSRGAPSLLMTGDTGLGKTHLSLAISARVMETGYGVVYTPIQKLMDKLEAAKFSYAADAKEQYARDTENILCCDLLVLDDLGAEFITQFSAAALYNIVNTRVVENRPTIVSTNLDPAEIQAKYSPRMLSRLMGDYRSLKFTGSDIRFIKKTRK